MILEVIIAVALLGIGSIAIMNLQLNTLGRVRQAQAHLSHLLKLQNIFFDPEFQKNVTLDDGPMGILESQSSPDFKTFKCEILRFSKKSELSRFADVHLVQAVGSWAGFARDYEESLIGLIYLAPKEEPGDQADLEESETPDQKAKSPASKKPEANPKQEKTA